MNKRNDDNDNGDTKNHKIFKYLNKTTLNPLWLSTLQFVRFLPALSLTFQAGERETSSST